MCPPHSGLGERLSRTESVRFPAEKPAGSVLSDGAPRLAWCHSCIAMLKRSRRKGEGSAARELEDKSEGVYYDVPPKAMVEVS